MQVRHPFLRRFPWHPLLVAVPFAYLGYVAYLNGFALGPTAAALFVAVWFGLAVFDAISGHRWLDLLYSVEVKENGAMSTTIEDFLYGADGIHGVVAITLSVDRIVLSVAPWLNLSAVKVAEFVESKITSIEVLADPVDDQNLPWDIIGFDCYPLSEQRWEFVLHCDSIEYAFESRWPTVRNP